MTHRPIRRITTRRLERDTPNSVGIHPRRVAWLSNLPPDRRVCDDDAMRSTSVGFLRGVKPFFPGGCVERVVADATSVGDACALARRDGSVGFARMDRRARMARVYGALWILVEFFMDPAGVF